MTSQKTDKAQARRQMLWNLQEKRKAIFMVQVVFDRLAKAFNEEYGPGRPLEYLQAVFEDLLEHLDQAPVPMAAIETFCDRFREITPSDLRWFWHNGSGHSARKIGSALEALNEYRRFKRVCELQDPCWKGVVTSGERIKPAGNPVDRAPVWNPATGRIYIKEIYRVTKQKPGVDEPLQERHVVFEERKVHGGEGYFTNPDGVPKVIPRDVIRPYPVLVEKRSEGWEYVMPEPGE